MQDFGPRHRGIDPVNRSFERTLASIVDTICAKRHKRCSTQPCTPILIKLRKRKGKKTSTFLPTQHGLTCPSRMSRQWLE